MRLIPFVMLAATACAGATAESPLTVTLGLSHDQTENALKAHQFCLERSSSVVMATQPKQVYPRCTRAAAEHGEAWVVATYNGDKLIELRRFERYGDDARAVERWNQLVEARMKNSYPDEKALEQIRSQGLLEPGTRSVYAFRQSKDTVVGVYLLTPSPPANANVLEKVMYVKP